MARAARLIALGAAAALAGCMPPVPAPVAKPVVPPPTSANYLATAGDLSTLAAGVRASGLAEILAGPGPYTVFAPNDAAFGRLAPGMAGALLLPENRELLARLLRNHVVAGALTLADLRARVAAGGGTTTLTSLSGDPLKVTLTNDQLTLADAEGNRSYVERGDVRRSNGVVHVVNGVLLPRDEAPAVSAPTPTATPDPSVAPPPRPCAAPPPSC